MLSGQAGLMCLRRAGPTGFALISLLCILLLHLPTKFVIPDMHVARLSWQSRPTAVIGAWLLPGLFLLTGVS